MNIGVVGSGVFGLTLANRLAGERPGADLHTVTILERREHGYPRAEPEPSGRVAVAAIQPQGTIHPRINVTTNPTTALANADLVILAITSTGVAEQLSKLATELKEGATLLIASKGLTLDGRTMASVARDSLRNRPDIRVCVLAGGDIAREISEGLPAWAVAVGPGSDVAASAFQGTNLSVRSIRTPANLQHSWVRPPMSTAPVANDPKWLEKLTDETCLLSAMKNIGAIYVGMLRGAGLPEQTINGYVIPAVLSQMQKFLVDAGLPGELVYDDAGMSDFLVTVWSGRNGAFGAFCGSTGAVPKRMSQDDPTFRFPDSQGQWTNQTVEGVAATAALEAYVRGAAGTRLPDFVAQVSGVLRARTVDPAALWRAIPQPPGVNPRTAGGAGDFGL